MTYKVTGACVDIEFLVMGPIQNNVYIIDDGAVCFVVDPSCEYERILQALGNRVPQAIVLTHAHWDHVGAAADLRQATGAPVIASAVDAPLITGERTYGPSHMPVTPCPVDQLVHDGDTLTLGNNTWQVLLTPGHTQGGICLFLQAPENAGMSVLVSGDTLFAGTHGRTDFEGGDEDAMKASLARLAQLPPQTLVLPGHNDMGLIERERIWINQQ